jgi:hypothetical protein
MHIRNNNKKIKTSVHWAILHNIDTKIKENKENISSSRLEALPEAPRSHSGEAR